MGRGRSSFGQSFAAAVEPAGSVSLNALKDRGGDNGFIAVDISRGLRVQRPVMNLVHSTVKSLLAEGRHQKDL